MAAKEINHIITQALREDAAGRDITTRALVPASRRSSGAIVVKENAVLCGLDIAKAVFRKLDKNVRFRTRFKDGSRVKRNTAIATVTGKTRALLTGERVALNFLGYLSGIATHTNKFVEKTRKQRAKIYDTRKTTPTLRILEKYAVQCGGANNHRTNLSEMVLIKDNHRAVCRPGLSIAGAVKQARRTTRKKLEIEVDNLNQLREALAARPDLVLLDNMSCAQMKKAVKAVKALARGKRPLLEASGGITLSNVAKIARTGVDRISVGSLTHSHGAIDVSMELS